MAERFPPKDVADPPQAENAAVLLRRSAGVVERGSLENCCIRKGTKGSNPFSSESPPASG